MVVGIDNIHYGMCYKTDEIVINLFCFNHVEAANC